MPTATAEGAQVSGGLRTTVVSSIRRTFAAHLPLYLCAIVFLAVTEIVVTWYGVPMPLKASLVFLETIPEFVILAIAAFAAREFWRLTRDGYPADPAKTIGRKLIAKFTEEERAGNIFHALVTLTPLMIAFAALKDEIPRIHPFAWDKTFMQMDIWLGGGVPLPARLDPYLDFPPITAGLNLVYDLWFVAMFGSLMWMAFSKRNDALRMQFLVAFAFSWFIAGNVLAVIFSSAGPCFYHGVVGGPDPYAAQLAYLRSVSLHWPVWSVRMQDLLWNSYATGDGIVRGISAMPSMHLTIATLLACLGWRMNRTWGIAATIFTALIAIGSIHLAWHYSVDTLAGIALTFVFWWSAGWAIRYTPRLVRAAAPASARAENSI